MITTSFTDVALGPPVTLAPRARVAYSITGTYTGTIVLEQSRPGRARLDRCVNTAGQVVSVTDGATAGVVVNEAPHAITVRARSTAAMTGTAVVSLSEVAASVAPTGSGLPAHATVAAREAGDAVVHQTTLVLVNTPLTLLMASRGGGLKIYDFPKGRIAVLGALGSAALITTSVLANTLNGAKTANWGVGSTVQATPTLATTEQNLLPTTAITSSATVNVAGAVSPSALAAAVALDGTTTPVGVYLNVGVETAADLDAEATVLVNGTMHLTWITLGDL